MSNRLYLLPSFLLFILIDIDFQSIDCVYFDDPNWPISFEWPTPHLAPYSAKSSVLGESDFEEENRTSEITDELISAYNLQDEMNEMICDLMPSTYQLQVIAWHKWMRNMLQQHQVQRFQLLESTLYKNHQRLVGDYALKSGHIPILKDKTPGDKIIADEISKVADKFLFRKPIDHFQRSLDRMAVLDQFWIDEIRAQFNRIIGPIDVNIWN